MGEEQDRKETPLTVEPVSNRYKLGELPWIVHFDMTHRPRFLIDGRDPDNTDMFLGYRVGGTGAVVKQSLTTGEGGRLAFHRSHFVEELPA